MTHAPFLKLFFITVISSPLLFPSPGAASCDLDNTPITLKLIDKPVKEILRKVEEQTTYTFDIRDHKSLSDKKSILLNQTPLSQTFRRLLKDTNYSIICNDQQKTLALVFLDKSSRPSSETARKADTTVTDNIAGIPTVFEDYNNKKARQTYTTEPGHGSELDGLTELSEAFEGLESKNNRQPSTTRQEQDSNLAGLAGLAAAHEDFESNKGQRPTTNQDKQVSDMESLANLSNALGDQGNTNSRQPSTTRQEQDFDLSGLIDLSDGPKTSPKDN